MTDAPFITPTMIRTKAAAAFARGVKRHEHGMNWNAPALATWLAEWDRCAEFAESVADSRIRPSEQREH